jgi:hypothetical protein
MASCHECYAEETVRLALGDTHAECTRCGRQWTVEWVRHNEYRHLVMPKMTLVYEGDNHWSSIGSVAAGIVARLKRQSTYPARNDMPALKAMHERHQAVLAGLDDGGAA